MKQKLFTLFLALAACVGTIFAETIDGIAYNFNETELTAEVTYKSPEYSGEVIIPSSVNYNNQTYSVTSIGYWAFANCSGLTSVTIPNSVTSIGVEAFSGCTGLPVVDNIRYADTYLVEAVDKTLSTYTIKDGTKWIGGSAFEGCKSLTSVTIPNSVTSIGGSAFEGCSGLTSIEIPNSVTKIGGSAFEGCTGLTSIEIPNSVTSIGGSAFSGCSGLTSVTIPNSVTEIGYRAFSGCDGLTSVTIPNSVTSIGGYAFYGCSGLTSIIVVEGNTEYDSRNNCNAIIKTATNTLVAGCKNTIIPNSVTSIGKGAFAYCSGLTSVTIPNSVTSIGDWAFEGCYGLTSVTIPNSVTSIGEGAFYGCTGLTSITCEAATPPACGYDVFYDVDKSIPLYVPAGSEEAYAGADEWKEFTNIQAIKTTGLEEVSGLPADDSSRKTLHNGQLLIRHDGKTYTVTGQEVK